MRAQDWVPLRWPVTQAHRVDEGLCRAEAALQQRLRSMADYDQFQATRPLVQCAALFCTYPAVAARAVLARVTLAKMSLALAVQMKGLGSML